MGFYLQMKFEKTLYLRAVNRACEKIARQLGSDTRVCERIATHNIIHRSVIWVMKTKAQSLQVEPFEVFSKKVERCFMPSRRFSTTMIFPDHKVPKSQE